MTSNAAVAVAPVADQASWIRETISQAEADPADAAVQDAGGMWWKLAAGGTVLVVLAALAVALTRSRKAPLD